VTASAADLELAFYEQFFFSKGVEAYPVQEKAFSYIFKGESLLVTVSTGTGKTMMAKAALFMAIQRGQTAVYTTPLRALTEEKYRELCADFGEDKVGFQTGDFKVNVKAPIQVMVAEILWNRIYGDRIGRPADIVVMDEGHYFNDPERGYVWEQSIIGLDPRTQLIILSATVGNAGEFCQWIYLTRRVEMQLVTSSDRRVPLYHRYREDYLIEVVRELFDAGEYPAILFVFGREMCFETARLLKSCRRFTSDEEREKIARACEGVIQPRGVAAELKPLLYHGIGIHHAGILPRYKQLVEQLTLERLIKFVVSTETISAGINLPAKRVLFPSLKKVIRGKPRLLLPAEYHQMAGRAGRPQFDTEGVALTLAPEEVVQEIRKSLKDAGKSGKTVELEMLRRSAYSRVRGDAVRNGDVTWDPVAHGKLIEGLAAPLRSQTRITAEQILAIGLPDLTVEMLPGAVELPEGELPRPSEPPPQKADAAYLHLNIATVLDNLLLPDREKREAHKRLAMLTANLKALGVLDEHGRQIAGEIIGKIRGVDGLFIYYCLQHQDLDYEACRGLCEFLVEDSTVQKIVMRKEIDKKKDWIRNRLRERRRDEPQVAWEDVEEEYDQTFPRELTPIEKVHAAFIGEMPHPELHGGKEAKSIWARMEEGEHGFMDFVEREGMAHEEGNLFSYLARVMRLAKQLCEITMLGEFGDLRDRIRLRLGAVDERVMDESW
jgi:hypothetical protein